MGDVMFSKTRAFSLSRYRIMCCRVAPWKICSLHVVPIHSAV